jgi:tRNA(fMet)-specific endonuclease VapC
MSPKYLLDSDVCVDALRKKRNPGNNPLERLLREGAAISVVSYGEVLEGVLYSRDAVADRRKWIAFLVGVAVLDVTQGIADVWAGLRGSLRMSGLRLPDNDLIIASTALYFEMTLVTGNARYARYFARVPGLELLSPD